MTPYPDGTETRVAVLRFPPPLTEYEHDYGCPVLDYLGICQWIYAKLEAEPIK